MKKVKTDNPILKEFANSKCDNDLFKEWDRDFSKRVKKLFQEVNNEQLPENVGDNKRVRKTRVHVAFKKPKRLYVNESGDVHRKP